VNKFRRLTVFLAEDNPDDIEIAKRAFKRSKLGYDLVIARDGEEALKKLKEASFHPDFVLMDINLPKLTGLQVLERVRKEKRLIGVPFVMLSASDREEDVRASYELGANSYIQKPVAFEDFVETLAVLEKYWFEVARLPRSA
jgi:CheY-like chemotaxis protein